MSDVEHGDKTGYVTGLGYPPSLALALLGPGALSVDGWRAGRRRPSVP